LPSSEFYFSKLSSIYAYNSAQHVHMPKQKIKILHTIRQGDFGGGETYLYNLVMRLNKQLFEPVVLSFTAGAMVDSLEQAGIKTYVIPSLKPFNFFIYPQVMRILKQEQIDILHIHGTRAGTNTLIAALLGKIKIVYTVHGWSFHTGHAAITTQLRILTERFLTGLAHLTVCGSAADLRQGKQHCPEGNYQLISNSIDTQYFNPQLPGKNLRHELGFTDTDLVVSFIARLTFQKDPFTFIRSIPAICKEVSAARFLMVGEGELKEQCLELASQLHVSDKITFLPFRKDVKDLLQLTDIFVLPSLWEVIPLGLLEAMAMEKCCIATNIPGTTEAITGYRNGILIDIRKPEQLAREAVMLAYNPMLRKKLGKNARQTVLTRFDIGHLVAENERVYSMLAGNAATPPLLTPDLATSFNNPFVAS
jgi:glycosyltransferase involved in cell wall biosynthesis